MYSLQIGNVVKADWSGYTGTIICIKHWGRGTFYEIEFKAHGATWTEHLRREELILVEQ